MEPIVQWLEGLGLGQYGAAFVQADIDAAVLPHLTEADLEKLGVTLGHRKKLLIAIAALSAPVGPSLASPPTAVAAKPEAERRQVTVMFCDLVGSTALAGRLDPEDLRELIGRYHACVAQTVSRHDGFVAKYMGDGVLIYFGYPRAHEDDAEQAARAGLALIDAIGELQAAERLRVRIGVATGLVVVGDLIGAGSAQEQAIVGETPNLAARLQALAEPNAIVIAESTRRQIGARFEVADLGPQSLKGFAEPQRAWRVLSENHALGRYEALRSGATPLVGRDEEMELLLRRWVQAKAGSGRVVLISAEPGVGKSRLAEALAEQIAGEPHVRLRYFCSPHHQDSALYPVIAQMERAAGFAREDAAGAKLAKLQGVLGATVPPIEDVALLAELHALPSADIAPPLDVTPQRKKEKTFEALLRQIERLSRRQPVLMVFEDIHWIDPSSRELLDRTVGQIADWPVLLVATFRPEFQPPWTGQPHVTILTLTRLDRRDTAAMVENIAGNHALPDEIVREIAERTDGVPLFVEELTKAVLESGAQGTAALSAAPHPALSAPATLHASLMARLDRLGSAAKDVAQKGAAIGREFDYELLASIADLPEPQLGEALDRLTNAGLLFVRGTVPQSSYIFKHALVQDAAYGTLLRTRRQQLHARIGEALETQVAEATNAQPESLAHHFTEAGQAEKAVVYWLKAGQQALARSTLTEASAQLRKGLDLVSRLAGSIRQQQQELDLQIALGRVLIAMHGYCVPEVGETYARARQLCELLDEKAKLIIVLFGQYVHHAMRGNLEISCPIGQQILDMGEVWDDNWIKYLGYRCNAVMHFYRGEFAAARECFERALALYDPAHRVYLTSLTTEDPYCATLLHLSWTLCCLGYLDQGRSCTNSAIAEARQSGRADSVAFAITLTLMINHVLSAAERLEHAEELIALSAKHGFHQEGVGRAARGSCLAESGKTEQGIALLKDYLSWFRVAHVDLWLPWALIQLAEAYGFARMPDEGLQLLAEASGLLQPNRSRWWEAYMHRLRGDLLRSAACDAAAEDSYHRGLAVARCQGAKRFELRAATSLARLWRDQGKIADAHDLLAPVYAWFTEGFDAPDLIDAKALLHDLA